MRNYLLSFLLFIITEFWQEFNAQEHAGNSKFFERQGTDVNNSSFFKNRAAVFSSNIFLEFGSKTVWFLPSFVAKFEYVGSISIEKNWLNHWRIRNIFKFFVG